MPREATTDLTVYASKAPTALQEQFADWIEEQTGKSFGTQKEAAAFREGVRLAMALIMRFQASRKGEPRAARATAPEEDNGEEQAAPPAKKAAKKAAAAKKTAPPAKATKTAPPAKRTRRAQPAPADDASEAPF